MRRRRPARTRNAFTSRKPIMANSRKQAERQAEHPRHLGRRHRPVEPELLHARADGLSDAQHRPARQGGHAVHRLLRRAVLHRRRSSFITGQSVYRTGLSKVGIPAAPIGMSEKIVTIAALLKEQGYATGQFGKNHLGDLNPCCRPITASTSSSATSTTSTPKKSRRWPTILRRRNSRISGRASARAA